MNLTKEEKDAACKAMVQYNRYYGDCRREGQYPKPFMSWVRYSERLHEYTTRKYRCIKDTYPFGDCLIGSIYESHEEIDYSEHPFHFEEIVPAPAPVTIKDIYDCIDTESPFCTGELTALFKRAKQEGNL